MTARKTALRRWFDRHFYFHIQEHEVGPDIQIVIGGLDIEVIVWR